MKKTLFGMLIILSVACTSNEEDYTAKSNYEKPVSALKVINSFEAEKIATDCVQDFSDSISSSFNMNVTSIYAWRKSEICRMISKDRGTTTNEENSDTLLYIVNFGEENGYALVSANSASPYVVAYIEKGSFRPDKKIENPGFKLFLSNITDSLPEIGGGRPVPEPMIYWANVDPLLQTKWGQGAPYNKFCFTQDGQQAVAGCVAIATAQIVAFHQYPSSYNGHTYDWDAILQNETVSTTDSVASNSVGHLVHDIGVLVGMNYGVSSSGAISYNVHNCWDAFGYNYTWNSSLARQNIINSLVDSIPVYMRGWATNVGGHAWVVDGSHFGTVVIAQGEPGTAPLTQTYLLVHCNWGWNGYEDGYFVLGAFERKFTSFTTYEDGHIAFNDLNSTFTNVHPIIP